ncbi:MAG: Uma2 family endonuclease [Candidatus Velthaea sp.]
MVEVPELGERVICLRMRFAAYEALVTELGDNAGARMTFDGKALELMSPSADHERYNRLLEGLVQLLSLEWEIAIESTGSATLKRAPFGAEPDSSFYVQNAAAIAGKKQLDLAADPPPDIAVEIDLSRERIDKQANYADFRVSEFWRYDGRQLRAYARRDGRYVEVAESEQLGALPIAELARFLELRTTKGQSDIARLWQAWLRDHRPPQR